MESSVEQIIDRVIRQLTTNQIKEVIKESIKSEVKIKAIYPLINALDERSLDKELIVFLESVEIKSCEWCKNLEYKSRMRSIGNPDYEITVCETCYGEQNIKGGN